MRRVRLRFLIALSVALLVLAHSLWDYVESRRLRERMDAIRASGAPTTLIYSRRLTGSAADADRYYRAAAALAGRVWEWAPPQLDSRLRAALRDNNWTPGLVADLRSHLDGQREALMLVDRAAPLAFDGIDTGGRPNYGFDTLTALSRLCEMRAVERALAGDGDGAFDSFYSSARLERVTWHPPQFVGLAFVMQRVTPGDAARSRLAGALVEIDRDDRLRQSFARLRAQMIDSRWQERVTAPWLVRPLTNHRFHRQLDAFGDLVAAAERPQAGRLDAVMAVGKMPTSDPVALPPGRNRAMLETWTRSTLSEMERVRCARRLVAGEVVNCLR